jgi:hypothetical protein
LRKGRKRERQRTQNDSRYRSPGPNHALLLAETTCRGKWDDCPKARNDGPFTISDSSSLLFFFFLNSGGPPTSQFVLALVLLPFALRVLCMRPGTSPLHSISRLSEATIPPCARC